MINAMPNFITLNKEKAAKVLKTLFVILSIITGFLFHMYYTSMGQTIANTFCKPVSSMYFNIIKVLAMPLMFCFVFCSFANDKASAQKNRLLIKNVLFTLTITAVSAILTGVIIKGFHSGISVIQFSSLAELLPQMIKELIPSSVTELIDGAHPLQLLIIGGLLGIIYKNLNNDSKLISIAKELKDILLAAIIKTSRFIWLIVGISAFSVIQNAELIDKTIAPIIIIMLAATVMQYSFQFIRHKIITHEPAKETLKKLFPSWRDAFITTSSTGVIPSSLKDLEKYSITGDLLQQGRCLSKPGTLANYIALIFYCTNSDSITLTWCLALLLVTTMLSFCIPPVSGGFNICLSVLFSMLSVDLSLMPFAIAIGALLDSLRTSSNVLSVNFDIIATEKKVQNSD